MDEIEVDTGDLNAITGNGVASPPPVPSGEGGGVGGNGNLGNPPAPAPADDPLLQAPQTWKEELKAQWGTLPAEIRAEIQRREADVLKGFQHYSPLVQQAKAFQQALNPFLPHLQQHGIQDPLQAVTSLLQADQILRTGTPQQKQAMLQRIMQDYGVQSAQEEELAPFVDPAVKGLQEQVAALQSQLMQRQQLEQQQQVTALQQQVDQFAADPANKHFDKVAPYMRNLLVAGGAKDLADAYEQACWLHPEVRKEMVTASQQQLQQQQHQQALQAKNRVLPTPVPKLDGTPNQDEDMDTFMQRELQRLKSS